MAMGGAAVAMYIDFEPPQPTRSARARNRRMPDQRHARIALTSLRVFHADVGETLDLVVHAGKLADLLVERDQVLGLRRLERARDVEIRQQLFGHLAALDPRIEMC